MHIQYTSCDFLHELILRTEVQAPRPHVRSLCRLVLKIFSPTTGFIKGEIVEPMHARRPQPYEKPILQNQDLKKINSPYLDPDC